MGAKTMEKNGANRGRKDVCCDMETGDREGLDNKK